MIRIYLLFALLLGVFWAWHQYHALPANLRMKWLQKNLPWFIGILFVVLTVTGKLYWLVGLCGVALTFLAKSVPFLLRHLPHFQQLWSMFTKIKDTQTHRQSADSPADMAIDEAYKVLGLEHGATDEEIILAHKRLMQKLHPDRGGSDYLASKINLAKAVLLKQ